MAAPGQVRHVLSRFHLNHTRHNTITLIGKRATGKTTLGIEIIKKCRFKEGYVMRGTNEDYNQLVPNVVVTDIFDITLLRNIITRQRVKVQQAREGKISQEDSWCFLFLDDVLDDRTVFRSQELQRIVVNGRCMHIFLVMTIQYPMALPVVMRANVSVSFHLPYQHSVTTRRKLWENYASCINTFDSYQQIYNLVTNKAPYVNLVIDNTTRSRAGSVRYYGGRDYSIDWRRVIRKARIFDMMNRRHWMPKEINRMIVAMI